MSKDNNCAREISLNTSKDIIIENRNNIEAYLLIVEKYLEAQVNSSP
jgi:hypothetical protein